MPQYGLLGEVLAHSHSPQIHRMLGEYAYSLYEMAASDIPSFLKCGAWDGLNVTIPYKKAVFPYMDEVGPDAALTGCVNTVVRRNGKLYGDNTDVYGFAETVRRFAIPAAGEDVLVLGSGGASAAVCAALKSFGCKPIVVSRRGEITYQTLSPFRYTKYIVNTTPLGMYPNNGEAAVDLEDFPHCRGVIDLIYNPLRTKLLLQAEEKGIPTANGLYMLVAQAKRSAELFTGRAIADEEIGRIYETLSQSLRNIVLIGMPGCGKSTLAKEIGQKTGRKVLDSDEEIYKKHGMTPSEMILQKGEAAFRDAECAVLKDIGKLSGCVIATGGGVVTRRENYASLRQNGAIVWLRRNVENLPIDNRPLSQKKTPAALYAEREPLYREFADISVDMDGADRDMQIENLLRGGIEDESARH
ncbi:MAG: shikimate kinase [Christensenellales bacterium]|jgi:shikimate dehydrogenase